MSREKKYVSLVIGTFIVLVLGASWLVSSRSKSVETAVSPWDSSRVMKNEKTEKTYGSPNLGISFNYPADFFVEESKKTILVTSIPPNDLRRESDAMMGSLTITLLEAKNMTDALKHFSKETLPPEQISLTKEISLDGYDAKKITSVPDDFSGSHWIYLLIATKKGIIQIHYMEETGNIYTPLLESLVIE